MDDKTPSGLMVALAKAEQEFGPIVKNRTNYNKGKYADLTAILDAVKPALLKHGIVVMQSPVTRYFEDGSFAVEIVTSLHHGASGESVQGILTMPCKADAQSIGSGITYGRRYALVSMLSLSSEDDDDGEEAVKEHPARQPQRRQDPPKPAANGHKSQPASDAKPWASDPLSLVRTSTDYQFSGAEEAIGWGNATGVFDDYRHAQNAYEEVKREKSPKSPTEMWVAWINEVASRLNKEEVA